MSFLPIQPNQRLNDYFADICVALKF